jgi:hypothetical protein
VPRPPSPFFDLPADGNPELHGCDEPDETACTKTKSIRKADGNDTIGYFDADDPVGNV